MPSSAASRLHFVLPGGSGSVGRSLARNLQEQGHQVTVLTRSPYAAAYETVHWDGQTLGPWVEALEGSSVCIHLAGPKLNGRPSAGLQQLVYRQRMHRMRLLAEAISSVACPPQAWMLASTADLYRHSLGRDQDEATGELGGWEKISRFRRAPAPWTFAATLARDCEALFFSLATPGTRKIALRLGLAMSAETGSPFAQLSQKVRMSLGGPTGNGRQFVSWIHERDLAQAVLFLAQREELAGAFNLTAPQPVQNRWMMAAMRQAWEVPNGIPTPGLLAALAERFQGAPDGSALKSHRVVPTRLLEAGFEFEFPEWEEACEDLVRMRKGRN